MTHAMAVAQLTNLHISIPKSGASPGKVPEECFPPSVSSRGLTDPCRVSFASGITVLGDDPILEQSPDILIHAPVCPDVAEAEDVCWICLSPFSDTLQDLRYFHGRGRSGEWMEKRRCLTFQGNYLAGFLGV